MALIPPQPINTLPGSGYWNDWIEKLRVAVNAVISGSISHLALTGVQGGNSTEQYHSTAAEHGILNKQSILIVVGDETTALVAGTSKVTFRMPNAMTLTNIKASVTTAPTGVLKLTVDVNKNASTILSSKLKFDASEFTTETSSTPVVISDANLTDDAEMTIDIDQVGGTIAGAGLKVTLIGTRIS